MDAYFLMDIVIKFFSPFIIIRKNSITFTHILQLWNCFTKWLRIMGFFMFGSYRRLCFTNLFNACSQSMVFYIWNKTSEHHTVFVIIFYLMVDVEYLYALLKYLLFLVLLYYCSMEEAGRIWRKYWNLWLC